MTNLGTERGGNPKALGRIPDWMLVPRKIHQRCHLELARIPEVCPAQAPSQVEVKEIQVPRKVEGDFRIVYKDMEDSQRTRCIVLYLDP